MSSAGVVMAREEGRAARVYTISLLLLLLTWTPFYIGHCVQVLSIIIVHYENQGRHYPHFL